MNRAKIYRRARDGKWRVLLRKPWGWDGLRAFPTHAAALAHALATVGLAPCECVLLPEEFHTTHYGATEPGSMYEYNPDCPAHGEPLAEVGLTEKNTEKES